jgi:hypothetical protein
LGYFNFMSKKLFNLSLLTVLSLTLSYCTGNKEQPAEETPAAEAAPADAATEAPEGTTEAPSH